MFRHRQSLRRWAARVLLLWLFGLGMGVATACLDPGRTAGLAALAGDAVLSTHCSEAADAGGQEPAPNCRDFCERAAFSIPPLKSTLDDLHSHAVLATALVSALPLPAYAPPPLRAPRRWVALAPPIPIAFLRLAL